MMDSYDATSEPKVDIDAILAQGFRNSSMIESKSPMEP